MTEGHNPWAGMQSKCVSLRALVHATHEQVSKAHGRAESRTVCASASERPRQDPPYLAPSLHCLPLTASPESVSQDGRTRQVRGVRIAPRRGNSRPDTKAPSRQQHDEPPSTCQLLIFVTARKPLWHKGKKFGNRPRLLFTRHRNGYAVTPSHRHPAA